MIKTRTETVIDVEDWDQLVQETYGRRYSFQQQDRCKARGTFAFSVPDATYDYENDSVPEDLNGSEMGVSFDAWLKRDPKTPIANQEYDFELELWWDRNFYPEFQMVANDLYDKGLIEEGEYTIDINW